MMRRVVESWLLLLYFDWLMHFRGFHRIHAVVRERKLRPAATVPESDRELSHAVDLACVFYFKRVLCLQRSAATAVLLRRHGWNAEMVIGAQLLPFQSHAWVEINGRVVNDKPYITEIFQVLERC
jgi:Transglutaminase-like superfamily